MGHLRSAIEVAPARPAVMAGLRAAIATVVPAIAGRITYALVFGIMAFVGLLASVADRGGSYRSRATTMLALGACCGLSAMVASTLGRFGWAAVPGMLVWGLAGGMAWAWGPKAGMIARMATIAFAVSVFTPAASLAASVVRGGFCLAGAAWATALAVAFWPLRPYRPARQAVAKCWMALSEADEDLAGLAIERRGDRVLAEHLRHHEQEVRQALEEATSTLVTARRGLVGESARGERLVVLLEGAFRCSAIHEAMADWRELLAVHPEAAELGGEASKLLRASAAQSRAIRSAILKEEALLSHPFRRGARKKDEPSPSTGPAPFDGGSIRKRADSISSPEGRVFAHRLADLFDRLGGYQRAAVAAATTGETSMEPAIRPPRRTSLLRPLRDHLSTDSVILRHSLRVGLTGAVAILVPLVLGIEKGQWIVIAALATLRPYSAETFQQGLQRTGGTLIGAVLAALLAALVHGPVGITILVFALAWVAVSLLPMNFGFYLAFLTPAFLILSEPGATDWHLAGIRMGNAALGAGLALASTWLLWPRSEVEEVPRQVAAAVRAVDDHLGAVLDSAARPPEVRQEVRSEVRESRRRVGIAFVSAEASFQRLLAKHREDDRRTEALLSLVTYARRFEATVTSVSTARSEQVSIEPLRPVRALAHGVLDDLAVSIERSRTPARLPAPEAWPRLEDPLLASLEQRIERQLAVLHGAVGRLSAGERSTS
ncbi:FUSC family protein [Vulgatibacter incomptus]|uniref:Uncharacterized protein n=1 Tax=Vulgatibacter incomptus TaxID=1391653 RepID=A0A0K1PAV2_9BACT|nr:FUSC family protein [Vulgatibacter incomptus]AKU90229.1 hypothetical protein AKJ08_0616 [Vulgatibacter incomptus]